MPNYDVITYTRPDDVVINLSDLPYTVHAYDGFGIGEFEHTMVAPPQTHGEYWYDTRMSAKVMTVEFSYTASGDGGVPEEQASRRSVIGMFNPLMGPGILRIDQVSGVSREIRCILAESLPLPKEEGEGPGHYRTVVRFKSHGIPAFIDPDINTFELDFTLNPGNFSFPWSFPRTFAQSGYAGNPIVTNIGDIESPVRIEMIGPMTDPLFRNETTDKTISLVGFSLTAGQHLVIDTDPEQYLIQVEGVDAWQYVNDIEMWGLAPGDNQLTFDLGGTTPASIGTVQWYTRYLGV
jgi:hypothetical protein